MRTDLDHLPAYKRRELERVLKILFEEFDTAMRGGSADYKRNGKILKVILFGSHATGKWVDNPKSSYFSDYDLLIVVNHDKLSDPDLWRFAEQRLLDAQLVTKWLKTPVGLIVHTLADVNEHLQKGRYFFIDILKGGIVLYDSGSHRFAKPEPLSPEEAFEEAQGYFDEWYSTSERRLKLARYAIAEGFLKEAAFELHQSVESAYGCALLVVTHYIPHTHNLRHLQSLAAALDPRFLEVWPGKNRFERRAFERLREAYVKARYSPHYKVTTEELAWLEERVELLQQLVQTVCSERLANLRGNLKGEAN